MCDVVYQVWKKERTVVKNFNAIFLDKLQIVPFKVLTLS